MLGALGSCLETRGFVLPGQHLDEAPNPSYWLIHHITPLLVSSCWKSGCAIPSDNEMM